jgi:hypothetical protein
MIAYSGPLHSIVNSLGTDIFWQANETSDEMLWFSNYAPLALCWTVNRVNQLFNVFMYRYFEFILWRFFGGPMKHQMRRFSLVIMHHNSRLRSGGLNEFQCCYWSVSLLIVVHDRPEARSRALFFFSEVNEIHNAWPHCWNQQLLFRASHSNQTCYS